MPAPGARAFDAASLMTSSPNNTSGSNDVATLPTRLARSQSRSLYPVAYGIVDPAGRRAADAGDSPQRHGFKIRRQQDLGRDDQGVSRRRGPHRGGFPPGTRSRGA